MAVIRSRFLTENHGILRGHLTTDWTKQKVRLLSDYNFLSHQCLIRECEIVPLWYLIVSLRLHSVIRQIFFRTEEGIWIGLEMYQLKALRLILPMPVCTEVNHEKQDRITSKNSSSTMPAQLARYQMVRWSKAVENIEKQPTLPTDLTWLGLATGPLQRTTLPSRALIMMF